MAKKKPIEVLIAEGKKHLTKEEIEQRRQEEAALRPCDDDVGHPDWLTDPFAIEQYEKISKELERLKLLTNLDKHTLACYCFAYSQYVETTKALQGAPLVVESTNKAGFTNQIENPLIRIQLKYSDEMKKHASEMGLTISSRLKLTVPKKEDTKPKNKFESFMSG